MPFSICRPGMIVGDSHSGWVKNFNTIYYILKLMLLGKLPILPVKPEASLNLVNVDYVADCVVDMVLVRGIGVGGTTTLATGNAVRYDDALKCLGIVLDEQFEALYRELPITTVHQKHWTDTTRNMFALFEDMGLHSVVTPKFLDAERCVGCGHCAIGCPTEAKWDTRELVKRAVENGAELVTGCRVTDLEIAGKAVSAVHGKLHGKKVTYHADLVVLAAGGLGTPVILEQSGIPCSKTLFVDPVLCVAGHLPGLRQDRQLLMPFISQQDGPHIHYAMCRGDLVYVCDLGLDSQPAFCRCD